MRPNVSRIGNVRGVQGLAAALYTLFVIYGSLVPLDFRALPWHEAVARFAAIPFSELGADSRVDWASNFLLFIPLTFLWMGALSSGSGRASRTLVALSLVPLASGLSFAIEFAQLFFQARTPSQNDIFAESLGGLVGVLIGWYAGDHFSRWLRVWQETRSRAALAEHLAWAYLAGLLVYNVLPLDLTLSPVEIFHKWQEGRINLMPFGYLPSDAFQAIYEIVTDILVWIPPVLLWRLDGTRNGGRAWRMGIFTAVALEFLQLLVFSRVSDTTDIVTAALGAALGSYIGGRLVARQVIGNTATMRSGRLPFALAVAWCVVLCFAFWFPFDFRIELEYFKDRLGFLERVPFDVYYAGTEYRAITEVLRKTLFFAPLGGFLAWGVACQPWQWRSLVFALSMLVLAGMPAVVEFGQTLLPHKIPDTTDWFLAWVGGLAGYALMRRMIRTPHRGSPVRPTLRETTTVRSASGSRHFLIVVAGMAMLFWGMNHVPQLPYNLRELLRQDDPLASALFLALACYWLAVMPVWLARRNVPGFTRLLQLPLGLLAYGGFAYLLLRMAVPEESVHDLTGSPVLRWPGQLETTLRWLALAAIPGAMLYLATQTLRRLRGRALKAIHFWVVIPILLLAYWGVVAEAATDNLTELLAAPYPLAFLALCLWLYLLFAVGILLASPGISLKTHVLGLSISFPVSILLLQLALEDAIEKYDQQFSALQFLLSVDRQHYASQPDVWLRYGVLYTFIIVVLAYIQRPYLRSSNPNSVRVHHADN